jgi:predicted Zn-dependent peptidase
MSAISSSKDGALAPGEHHDVVLSNGLRVVLVPEPHVHRAVASLYLRAGSRYETKDTNGISHFLEHMLFRGTPTYPSAHAQALAFERLGGTLYAATHVDHGVMSVTVPPKNLAPVLELLGEVAASPLLTELEVERGIVREEILEDLDDDGRDIDADNLVRALMYEDHPLGYTITGHIDSLDTFDEPLLRAHHARHYTAANSVLCIAGRIGDLDAVARAAERCFGALPRGERVQGRPPRMDQKKARVRFVENQSSQTELRVAFRAIGERDPIEPAVEMLLRILDDGMSTRLYERICDRLGLCYDVSGSFEAYEDDGVVDVAAGARHSRTPMVAKEIFTLLHELSDHGPTDEELQKARDRHLWSVEAMRDDPEESAAFHGLAALAGLTRSPAVRHEELCAATREEVRAAAQRIFRAERLSITAVGLLKESDVSKLEKSIKALG